MSFRVADHSAQPRPVIEDGGATASRISEYRRNRSFADEMVQGPYKLWYHRHLFRDVDGGVEMRDVVVYELPFGVLGHLVHRAVVEGQLAAIFDYRRAAVADLFGGSGEEGKRR